MWCDTTVKYQKWFNSICSSIEELLTNKVNELFLSPNNRHSLQLEILQTSWRRQERQSTRERISNRPLSKPLCLPKSIEKMDSRYKLGTDDLFRWDNHPSKYSKRISVEVTRKKRIVKHSTKVVFLESSVPSRTQILN